MVWCPYQDFQSKAHSIIHHSEVWLCCLHAASSIFLQHFVCYYSYLKVSCLHSLIGENVETIHSLPENDTTMFRRGERYKALGQPSKDAQMGVNKMVVNAMLWNVVYVCDCRCSLNLREHKVLYCTNCTVFVLVLCITVDDWVGKSLRSWVSQAIIIYI